MSNESRKPAPAGALRARADRLAAWVGRLPLFWSVLFVLVLAVLAAALVWAIVGAVLLGDWTPWTQPARADINPTDVLKLSLSVIAGLGGVIALTIAYRRQRDHESLRFEQGFAAAAAQLGGEAAAVRIAGGYAMAALADEQRTDARRQQCIDYLCGYLRLPYQPSDPFIERTTTVRTQPSLTGTGEEELTEERRLLPQEREVRVTIIAIIRDHLRTGASTSWRGKRFDFTGAIFDAGGFSDVVLVGEFVFDKAQFHGPFSFNYAKFQDGGSVTFTGAEVQDGGFVTFYGAEFQDGGFMTFIGAKFQGGGFMTFDTAKFQGDSFVTFDRAEFQSDSVVSFFAAEFQDGCHVSFDAAKFQDDCRVPFAEAKFQDGCHVSFDAARFQDGCHVSFDIARFQDGCHVSFVRANFQDDHEVTGPWSGSRPPERIL